MFIIFIMYSVLLDNFLSVSNAMLLLQTNCHKAKCYWTYLPKAFKKHTA